MQYSPRAFCSSLALAALVFALLPITPAQALTRRITFPIIGAVRFSNDFGAPRVGHTHAGNDVFGSKGLPLVAAVDGRVQWVLTPGPGRNLGFSIIDDDGYAYWYLHVNNDTPGTDDGASRGIFAYAPDLYGGKTVVAGQLLGWLGDSGNAESTPPHLHFEIHTPDGEATNPFNSLTFGRRISRPVTPPALDGEILPYGQFTRGASVALGELDPYSVGEEIVTGAGPGGGPHVRVFSRTGEVLAQFSAFESNFRGGIDVATGDRDGDGIDEIIVGPGPGRRSEVRVFTTYGVLQGSITAYTPSFSAGVHVAAADLTGDGRAEIVTGPLRGGGPHVRVFDGVDNHLVGQVFSYGSFRGGIDVAAFPATAETPPLIATVPLQGYEPRVHTYDARDFSLFSSFLTREQTNRAGMRISMGNFVYGATAPNIAVVPETKGMPRTHTFDIYGNRLSTIRFLEPWWQGGYDVAAGATGIVTATATPAETRRRTTVRWIYGPFEPFDAYVDDGEIDAGF